MLPDGIAALIRQEQARQGGRFVEGADLEAYLRKLGMHAELLAHYAAGECRGFVAFYANDRESRRAYITLVLVVPESRGEGLGRALVEAVLGICRARGFISCRLEVRNDNDEALATYRAVGFTVVSSSITKLTLEVAL